MRKGVDSLTKKYVFDKEVKDWFVKYELTSNLYEKSDDGYASYDYHDIPPNEYPDLVDMTGFDMDSDVYRFNLASLL